MNWPSKSSKQKQIERDVLLPRWQNQLRINDNLNRRCLSINYWVKLSLYRLANLQRFFFCRSQISGGPLKSGSEYFTQMVPVQPQKNPNFYLARVKRPLLKQSNFAVHICHANITGLIKKYIRCSTKNKLNIIRPCVSCIRHRFLHFKNVHAIGILFIINYSDGIMHRWRKNCFRIPIFRKVFWYITTQQWDILVVFLFK